MSNDDNWITTRVANAREPHPSVTDAAAARMVQLLTGRLSEGQLPAAELTSVAKALIEDMAPAPPKAEAEQ